MGGGARQLPTLSCALNLVADRRAPTPSAAAEMVVPDKSELVTGLLVAEQALSAAASVRISAGAEQLDRLQLRLDHGIPDLDTLRLRIDDRLRTASVHLDHRLQVKSERSQGLSQRLTSLSPTVTLRRGYAVVQRQGDGSVVNDAGQIDAGDAVNVTLSRGSFDAKVTSARTNGRREPIRRTRVMPSE